MTSMALETSTVKTGALVKQISADGTFAAGTNLSNESITLINLTDLSSIALNTETASYSPGNGNFVSNDGTVVGSLDATASRPCFYSYDSKAWTELSLSASDSQGVANGISADGSYICGQVTNPADGELMARPVLWSRSGNGAFGEYVALPCPTIDFSGRTPQYVTAISINRDGTAIVGQVRDYSGTVTLPILYTKAANGEWSYKYLWDANPNGVEITAEPEYPQSVNAEDFMTSEEIAAYNAAVAAYYAKQKERPSLEDFMSQEHLDAYNAAMEEWWSSWAGPYPEVESYASDEEKEAYNAAFEKWKEELGEYPQMTSFMAEEELAAYNAAVDEYNQKMEAYDNWSAVFDSVKNEIPQFDFNNIFLSSKGLYAVSTEVVEGDWRYSVEDSSTVYLFDLTTGSYSKIEPAVAMQATYVNDEGVVLAAAPLWSSDATAYIKTADANDFVELLSYVQNVANNEVYEWMKENMEHTYFETDWEWNGDIGDYEEVTVTINETITGTPCADAKLNIVGSYAYNKWDEEAEPLYSYFMLLNKAHSGISDIASSKDNKVEIYDINGRRLSDTQNLVPGIYIVRATDAQGNVISKKVKY